MGAGSRLSILSFGGLPLSLPSRCLVGSWNGGDGASFVKHSACRKVNRVLRGVSHRGLTRAGVVVVDAHLAVAEGGLAQPPRRVVEVRGDLALLVGGGEETSGVVVGPGAGDAGAGEARPLARVVVGAGLGALGRGEGRRAVRVVVRPARGAGGVDLVNRWPALNLVLGV